MFGLRFTLLRNRSLAPQLFLSRAVWLIGGKTPTHNDGQLAPRNSTGRQVDQSQAQRLFAAGNSAEHRRARRNKRKRTGQLEFHHGRFQSRTRHVPYLCRREGHRHTDMNQLESVYCVDVDIKLICVSFVSSILVQLTIDRM